MPISFVGWVVLTYALNLPYWDDFLVQDHLLRMKRMPGRQQLVHLFDQHWEHRILWTRVLFALMAKLNGALNYYALTLMGGSGLLVCLGIVFAQFRRLALPMLYFVPIPFILVTLQSYENLLWAMASLQNFWIVVFALGTFYALARHTPSGRWLALGLALLATFTSGNGSIVLMAGLLVVVYQRQGWFLGVWSMATILALVGYFSAYQPTSFFPSPDRYPISDWGKAFLVFLGAFGNASLKASNSPDATLWGPMLLGGLFVGLVSLFLASGLRRMPTRDEPSSFFLGCFSFLFATAVITVYSRVGFGGPAYLLQSRYRIYSALLLSLVYLYSLYHWRYRTFLPAYLATVLLLNMGQSLASDYWGLEGIINQRRRISTEYFNYLANTPTDHQRVSQALFVPTASPLFGEHLTALSSPTWWSAPGTVRLDSLSDQPFMYHIAKVDAINPDLSRPDQGSYLYFKSPTHTYLFAAQPLRLTSQLSLGPYFRATGFYAHVLKEKLVPGRYRLGLMTHQPNRIQLAMTNQYVSFGSL
ncbi:hypothetical protein GCM10028774_41400 [Spirosoma jeollabukense]